MPAYADKFPQWSEHSSAILQYILWTALEQEGLGANLQHYNPLIDGKVQAEWKAPESWKLTAQLVFGTPVGQPREKMRMPVDDRVKVFGAQ
jgi:predicted oxidoreductase (fatty acid repression mutant protein)